MLRRSVTVLGSTGSVGVSTLDLLGQARESGAAEVAMHALTGSRNVALLAEQARAWRPKLAVVADPERYAELKERLAGTGVEVAAGAQAVADAAGEGADWVMSAIVGAAGLAPTMAAARAGAIVGLANKESLVCAGPALLEAAHAAGGVVIPVDSEHSAIFQVLQPAAAQRLARLILTASGGPFRTWSVEEMASVSPEQAVAHPNWSMGAKISVDSATMMNKGLEMIEASYLFATPETKIEVLVHPQSVVHSMVEYEDGSTLAQLGAPDMRAPIACAFAWPDRLPWPAPRLDLAAIGSLTFEPPDPGRFPSLDLARQALRAGEGAPAALNAANEVAVAAFLDRRIGFLDIARAVAETLDRMSAGGDLRRPSRTDPVEEAMQIDRSARRQAAGVVSRFDRLSSSTEGRAMLDMLQTVLVNVLPFLFVLTLVVTVHELGHFGVARALGVAVDRFSIGFGRPIFSRTDKSGVEWRFGWIPLGGYVRFAGDAEASSSVPDGEDLSRLKADIVSREGSGAEQNYFHFKPVWVKALVVAAGPVANFILAIVLFAVMAMAVGDTVVTPRVGAIQPGSPAERAGFQPGDMITGMDGREIDNFFDVRQYVFVRAEQPIRFTVDRGGQPLELVATPERRTEIDRLTGAQNKIGVLGLGTAARPGDIYRKRYAPAEAVVEGVEQTWNVLSVTTFYLGRIVRGLESGDQLGGPLRIAATSAGAAKVGAEGATDAGGAVLGGLAALIMLAAVLSVGIGFMNLLPVPVLDGGHLLFYAYEAIARRPVGAKVQAAGYRVGLALLLGLMLFATWNDLQQLRVFKLLGGLFS